MTAPGAEQARGAPRRGFGDTLSPPAWLLCAGLAAVALALLQLCWEVLALRPGYGVGDESYFIRRLVDLQSGEALPCAGPREAFGPSASSCGWTSAATACAPCTCRQ